MYLVASGVMDMFDKLDAVDTIKFSGLDSDGWYIDSARKALESGRMLYAGKYSKPDYELLVSENCSLAIENTMITHSPQVTEKLKSFDIPSIIEYSSYEEEPLGRVEWVKFFGALTDRDEKADSCIFLYHIQWTGSGAQKHRLCAKDDFACRRKIYF